MLIAPAGFVRLDRLRARGASPGRSCGPCTVCCTVMAVPSLRKPSRRACDHVDRDGCRVHAERPTECREFHCLWLRGALGDDERARPDALGVLFDHFVTRGDGRPHTLAFELWEGALDAPEGRSALDALAQTHAVAVSRRDGTWWDYLTDAPAG